MNCWWSGNRKLKPNVDITHTDILTYLEIWITFNLIGTKKKKNNHKGKAWHR